MKVKIFGEGGTTVTHPPEKNCLPDNGANDGEDKDLKTLVMVMRCLRVKVKTYSK